MSYFEYNLNYVIVFLTRFWLDCDFKLLCNVPYSYFLFCGKS